MASAEPKSLLEDAEVGSSLWKDAWRRLRRNRVAVASGILLVFLSLLCIIHPEVSEHAYDKANLQLGPTPPSARHWMGTDDLGRDLFARVTFGGRVSLAVGVIATIISFVIGVSWGGIAGYFGKRTDALMMRFVDVLYTIPLLIIVILLTAFYAKPGTIFYDAFIWMIGLVAEHPKDPKYLPLFKITFVFAVLGSVSWLTMARIVRGQVISLRSQPFVEAARDMAIVFRHLVPNALGPIIVYTTLTIPEVMMVEAFLSFLGLGTEEPLSSWGQLVAGGAENLDLYPWMIFFPGAMLALTLFCFNFLGDGLRDALDPKVRKD
jgi:oligopeptide transport system permease protein